LGKLFKKNLKKKFLSKLTRPSYLAARRFPSARAYASASSILALQSRNCCSNARFEASASAAFSRS